MRLLGRLIAAPALDAAARAALKEQVEGLGDWTPLLRLASAQLVAPALLPALREHGLDAALPEQARAFLAAANTLNELRNARIARELEAVAMTLNAAGIVPVLLKGNALMALGAYRTPGCRVVADIDLLVPGDGCSAAIAACRAVGYESKLAATQPVETVIHPEIAMKPGSIAALELHREFLNIGWRGLLGGEAIVARATPVPIGRAQVAVPCDDDLVAIAVAHTQLRDLGHYSGKIALRALLDIDAVGRVRRPDWTAVHARFASVGLEVVLDAFMELVDDLGGARPDGAAARSWRGRLGWLRQRTARRVPWIGRGLVVVGALRVGLADMRVSPAMRRYVWSLLVDPTALRRKLNVVLDTAPRPAKRSPKP